MRNTTPRGDRYESLDFWRGIACLAVIAFHSTFYVTEHPSMSISGAVVAATTVLWLGVPMFFTISGYCSTAAIESAKRRQSSVRTYFFRRFRRIYPPFWIFLVGTGVAVSVIERALVPGLFNNHPHFIGRLEWLEPAQLFGNLTLTETWRPLLFGSKPGFFVGHVWTLCYEEQFYAVMGFLLLLSSRHVFLGVILVTTIVVVMVTLDISVSGSFLNAHWLEFSAGVFVYYALQTRRQWQRRGIIGILTMGLCWQLLMLYLGGHSLGLLVSFSFGLVLIGLWPYDKQIAYTRSLAPVSFCGRMCYSLYLVHWPVCKAVSSACYSSGIESQTATLLITVPLCYIASLSIGWQFHLAVERRFLNSPLVGTSSRSVSEIDVASTSIPNAIDELTA